MRFTAMEPTDIRNPRNMLAFLRNSLYVFFLRFFFKKIGKNTLISPACNIYAMKKISLGHNVFINRGCRIDGRGTLTIGNFVLIGPGCFIMTSGHRFDIPHIPIVKQGIVTKPITIKDNVWLGAGVFILPGVTIGKGAVIGAGSVVTENVNPYAVMVGNPARFIKWRFGRKSLRL